MKISNIKIQNFRSFKNESIDLDDYTCFVGPNGCGKSTILAALNIFFRESSNGPTGTIALLEDDFYYRNVSEPIEITLTFEDLNDGAQIDFKDYYRQGKLIISAIAEWNPVNKSAEVKQKGHRLGMEAFRVYFDLDKQGKSATDLKSLYNGLRKIYTELPAETVKSRMADALREYENGHPELKTLIPSEDEFYGISRGANLLQKYVQWVYIPAVKDASTEQLEAKSTALGRLLERTLRSQPGLREPFEELERLTEEQYKGLLQERESLLDDISEKLDSKFKLWSHQNAALKLKWQTNAKLSIPSPLAKILATEGSFEAEVSRFGHGLQRSFIFTLLQELSGSTQEGPSLILGSEEPELYQHPPQARHMSSVLHKLGGDNSQVLVCTHSPYFISGQRFENIRVIKNKPDDNGKRIKQAKFNNVANRIGAALGERPQQTSGLMAKVEQDMLGPLSEMFFAATRVLVEGLEDIAYISTYLTLMEKWDEFRGLGCHIVQSQNKSNLVKPLAIAVELGLPTFVIFDGDGDKIKPEDRIKHERENTAILKLLGEITPNPFPAETFWRENAVMWPINIGEAFSSDIGEEKFTALKEEVRGKYKIFIENGDKNSLFVSYLLTEAWEQGLKSKSLILLCENVLKFARNQFEDNTPAMDSSSETAKY